VQPANSKELASGWPVDGGVVVQDKGVLKG
jgi:hypothetical protein